MYVRFLQVRVAETMRAIRRANIKLWMLTGDKLTTANTIAFNTELLTRKQRVLCVAEREKVDK